MKIRNSVDPSLSPVVGPTNGASVDSTAVGSAGGKPAASTGEDKVEISEAARSMQNSSFDQKKVDDVKKLLASGELRIQAERIADKMISHAAELLERMARAEPDRR